MNEKEMAALTGLAEMFEGLTKALLPEGVEVKQTFPWENAMSDLDEALNAAWEKAKDEIKQNQDQDKNNSVDVKDQPLKACRLFISKDEIANRLGYANPSSIMVVDIENNSLYDGSIVMTVAVDSTAVQNDVSNIEISSDVQNVHDLRRQKMCTSNCFGDTKDIILADLHDKLGNALNERDILLATYGDSVHVPDNYPKDAPITATQYQYGEIKRTIHSLNKVIELYNK